MHNYRVRRLITVSRRRKDRARRMKGFTGSRWSEGAYQDSPIMRLNLTPRFGQNDWARGTAVAL